MKQLESSFKRTISWNKYQPKQTFNRNLDFLNHPSFQEVNRLFLLSKDSRIRESYSDLVLSTVEKTDYNVVTDWRNLFDQQVKNDVRTYDNITNVAIGQGDDYTTD